jgi:transcriptional regulator with XRE-family HTH domain
MVDSPDGGAELRQLSDLVRERRSNRGWTQEQLADNAGISVDSIRRFEGGRYTLPIRPRKDTHVLDRLAGVLGLDVCTLVRTCFTEEEIAMSVYRRCLDSPRRPRAGSSSGDGRTSLRDFVDALPREPGRLIAQAGMVNAHAIAFLIALEDEFSAFEFLVTNQPPFMLFADDEYVTKGSSSTELPEEERETYHTLIFDHQRRVRESVRRGQKHYKVVLHYQSVVGFLNARSRSRSVTTVRDIKNFLRYDGLDLLILDSSDVLDEFEVLSRHYPPTFEDQAAVSIRHRRIGVENTLVYQLALIGSSTLLVRDDFNRAQTLWDQAARQTEAFDDDYAPYDVYRYPIRHKRITARRLDDALEEAHPIL